MATYPAIDGVPAHASKKLLTSILRQELGFDGLVLSEGGGIGTLVYEGLAATQKEAGALALAAGRRRRNLVRVGLHARPAGQRARAERCR